MDLSNYVSDLPFTQNAPQHVIQTLNELAQLKELNAGDMLAQQFEVGHSLYFLVSGEISISIPLQESGKSSCRPNQPIIRTDWLVCVSPAFSLRNKLSSYQSKPTDQLAYFVTTEAA